MLVTLCIFLSDTSLYPLHNWVLTVDFFFSFADLTCPSLDTETAHPKLEITKDRKKVFWRRQPVSEGHNPRPYDSQYSVVAQESFRNGQHYWEVIVQDKPFWMIGVTTGSVSKKESLSVTSSSLGVNDTSWCIYHGDGQYLACHDTHEKQLSVAKRVRKLGILANLHKGELSFYNADAMTLLHSFCVQCSEPLYPVFNPCIDVNGLNRQPLTLFWIKDPWDWHSEGYTNETNRVSLYDWAELKGAIDIH